MKVFFPNDTRPNKPMTYAKHHQHRAMKQLKATIVLLLTVSGMSAHAQYTGGIGCGDIAVRYLPFVSTGVSKSGVLPQLCVRPNPTSAVATVMLGAAADRVIVLDATGRAMHAQGIGSTMRTASIDLSAYGCGLYMVQVHFTDGTSAMVRTVKE